MSRWVDALGVVAVVTAIALGIASLTLHEQIDGRLRVLEKQNSDAVAEKLARTPAAPGTCGIKRVGNVFFSGTDHHVRLDKSIFGHPVVGDLDQYDIVHPAVLAEGAVLVRGSGRVILDGDASDLILKIDNEYFSLRELFGIGPGIDASARAESNPAAAPQTTVPTGELCGGTALVPETRCPRRRNFGIDSCNRENTVCYCGGGYDYLTSTIRHRHLYCPEPQNCSGLFFGEHLNAYCCAPGADIHGKRCKTAWDSVLSQVGGSQSPPYWIDKYATCSYYEEGTLCQNVDRSAYLDMYRLADIGNGLLDNPEDLQSVRDTINLRTWGITRDYVFDDGGKYRIVLGNDVYGGCPRPWLLMRTDNALPHANYAYWDCDTDGSPLTFVRDTDPAIIENIAASYEWGAMYRALVHSDVHQSWFCLTRRLNATEQTHFLGAGSTDHKAAQVYFVQYVGTNARLCASLFLGSRDLGDHVAEKSLGFDFNDPARYALDNENLSPGAAYAILPV